MERIGNFAQAAVAKLKAGLIETTNLIAKKVVVEEKIISPIIETEKVTTQRIKLSEIAPASEDGEIIVSNFGKLIFRGKEGQEVASIDNQGNATFAGELETTKVTSDQLSVTGEATVEGTLYAEKIVAGEIVGLKGTFGELLGATASATYITQNITNIYQGSEQSIGNSEQSPASESAKLSPEEIEAMVNEILSTTIEPTPQVELSNSQISELRITNNLSVWGSTSLADTIIAGTLNVGGNLVLADGAINTLSGPLYLQNLGLGGVDILAGKVVIDEHGNAVFGGNVEIRGRLATKEISPLEGQDVVINLANLPIFETQENGESSAFELPSSDLLLANQASSIVNSGFGKLLIKGVKGEIVASIDASGSALFAGDLVASGSGTFEKLIIASREASQSGEIIPGVWVSNASVGTAVLPAGTREMIIYSPAVKEESLVYLTPLSSTQNNVLYVKAKKATSGECKIDNTPDPTSLRDCGWFKVGVDTPLTTEVKFNWWIIDLRRL